VPDVAEFIYEAASHLARSREALRRQDTGALRVAVLALRDASQAAGAERMLALCGTLRDDLVTLGGEFGARPCPIESVLDAIADEFDQVASDLQTARSA
jgi:HPt (histidine-containing phosphotransfer) domain-containing protein